MNTTAMPGLTTKRQHQAIEGPTAKQAKKMAALRIDLLAREQSALAAGNDDLAFELGCSAFDLEADLLRYGYAL